MSGRELRNLAALISGRVQLLRRQLPNRARGDAAVEHDLAEIEAAVVRLVALADDIDPPATHNERRP